QVAVISHKKSFSKVEMAGNEVQLGVINLIPEATTLKEVTVTATKPFLEQRADKLIVNVESSATAAGSTALEVLQKVPGVIVRNETVTLAGKSSVQIMIDGRPSQYTDINQVLANLSAANIEK